MAIYLEMDDVELCTVFYGTFLVSWLKRREGIRVRFSAYNVKVVISAGQIVESDVI